MPSCNDSSKSCGPLEQEKRRMEQTTVREKTFVGDAKSARPDQIE
jgi:hypothetical protein